MLCMSEREAAKLTAWVKAGGTLILDGYCGRNAKVWGTLVGIEGDGAIEFQGTYTSISFTTANPEYWNGFTLGAPVYQSVPDTTGTLILLTLGLLALGFWKANRNAAAGQA